MRIILNGEPCEVEATWLDQILLELKYTAPMIATAVNSQFIHTEMRNTTSLVDGDQLEVLSPISGG